MTPPKLPPRAPVRELRFTVTCPTCNHEPLELVAGGNTTVTQTQTIVRCPPCRSTFLVQARVARLTGSQASWA